MNEILREKINLSLLEFRQHAKDFREEAGPGHGTSHMPSPGRFHKTAVGAARDMQLGVQGGMGVGEWGVQWGAVGSLRKDFLIESLNRVLKAKEEFTNWTKRETASWPEETV